MAITIEHRVQIHVSYRKLPDQCECCMLNGKRARMTLSLSGTIVAREPLNHRHQSWMVKGAKPSTFHWNVVFSLASISRIFQCHQCVRSQYSCSAARLLAAVKGSCRHTRPQDNHLYSLSVTDTVHLLRKQVLSLPNSYYFTMIYFVM